MSSFTRLIGLEWYHGNLMCKNKVLVSVNGQIIGADYDEAMIAEAEQRVEQAGVNT